MGLFTLHNCRVLCSFDYLSHNLSLKVVRVIFPIKGTVCVISSDPQFKDANFRFITVPLKTLCGQV